MITQKFPACLSAVMGTSFLTATATLCAAATLDAAPENTPARPNILVILSDDMGFTDIGCYGGEIKTPALDRLAGHGLRFTQFYNSARCCPTRASLLTGLYPHQAGMGHMTNNAGLPGYTGSIRENCVTIAEMLRPAGYSTYALGKWHVARGIKETANHPLQRGFEKYYGTIGGAGSYYDPATLCRDNTLITPENDPEYRPQNYYYTDAIADNAILFLRQHQRATPGKPFFMYVAFTAAHWPMHALPGDIEKYQGVYDKGYDAIRAARHKRALELGVIDPSTRLSPADNPGWKNVTNKKWEIRCMEVYAAIIDRMDQNIARILAQLAATNQLDNTIIMFMQDNGACAELLGRQSGNRDNTRQYRPLGPDDLQPRTRPPNMQTRDGRPVRTGPGVMPGPADTYIACGHNWANVSNTPFREYKHWVHEGGISTPLIVCWQKGIDQNLAGGFVKTPAHLVDIAATCLDLSAAKYPAKRGGVKLTPLPGISLRPSFTGKQLQRPAPLFWEHEGNRAVRDGRWKLVAKGRDGPWELYDMDADRSERDNLAAQNKPLVRRLSDSWEQWAQTAKAKPWPWNNGKKNRPEKKGKNTADTADTATED
jgi:arylsulfatase